MAEHALDEEQRKKLTAELREEHATAVAEELGEEQWWCAEEAVAEKTAREEAVADKVAKEEAAVAEENIALKDEYMMVESADMVS